MDRLEDLAHNADYDEEIKRLLNQGYDLDEAEQIYAGELELVRDLQNDAMREAYDRMQEEAS